MANINKAKDVRNKIQVNRELFDKLAKKGKLNVDVVKAVRELRDNPRNNN